MTYLRDRLPRNETYVVLHYFHFVLFYLCRFQYLKYKFKLFVIPIKDIKIRIKIEKDTNLSQVMVRYQHFLKLKET